MSNNVEVQNEEIIVHPDAIKWLARGWRGEARIMGRVTIEGDTFTFDKVVKIRFKRVRRGR